MISYAQNFEDVLLQRVFSETASGFYIDIGAFDPVIGSVTKAFYDRGWRGINIEPGLIFEKLLAERPRDINLQLAVWDKAGELSFFEDQADLGTSRVVGEQPDEDAGTGERLVPCDMLDNIVRTHAADEVINFLKIDAEGSESRIIRSTDWTRLRPQIVLVEATAPWSNTLVNQDWEPILLEKGFTRAYFDGINVFYVRNEDADLLRHFDVPVNVLDRFEIFNARFSQVIAQLESTHAQLESTHAQLESTQAQLESTQAQLVSTQAQLVSTQAQLVSTHAQLECKQAEVQTWHEQTSVLQRQLEQARAESQQWQEQNFRLEKEYSDLAQEVERSKRAIEEQKAIEDQMKAQRPRTMAKKVLLPVYRTLLSPVVRPLAWRIRTFLYEPHREQQERLSQVLNEVSNAAGALAHAQGQLAAVQARNEELAKSIEVLVLSLAVQTSHARRRNIASHDLADLHQRQK
jgi:FkbM family methyltransferase